MTDFSELSNDELQQLYLQNARATAAPQHGVLPTPGMKERREYDPTSPEFQEKYGPTSGMGDVSLMRAGVGQGMMNVVRHAGNLVGLESSQELQNAKALDAPLLNTGAGRFGSMAGESAVLAPAMLGGEAALGTTAMGSRMLGAPILRGALEGAAQGGLMADPGEKLPGMVLGAGTGAAIPATLSAAKRLAYGIQRTPEAQQLMDAGVRLTPGQMNPEGVWNKIEENVRGIPKVGNIVENARMQAQQDFQRQVIEEAAAPGYTLSSPSKDVNELFQEAQDSYKPMFDAAKGFPVQPEIVNTGQNVSLEKALQQAAARRTVGATKAAREQAADFLDGQLEAFADKAQSTGGWKSDHLIELRSRINEEIRNAGQDQAGKAYAQLLQGARDKVTDALESQLPKDATVALRTANDAYPKLAIIRDAIRRGGDQSQGFTPAQLSQAVREAADNNSYARGGGLMRDWSSAGREIFTERNPRTGASHGTTGALAGLAYGIHHFVPGAQIPAAIGAAGALGAVGTETGRRLISGQTAPQQAAQRLGEALQRMTTPGQREALGVASRTLLNRAVPTYLTNENREEAASTGR